MFVNRLFITTAVCRFFGVVEQALIEGVATIVKRVFRISIRAQKESILSLSPLSLSPSLSPVSTRSTTTNVLT